MKRSLPVMRWYHRLAASCAALGLAVALALPLVAHAQGQGTGPLPGGGVGTYGPPISAINGHISFGGPPPTINAACGTAPTAPQGTDSAFFFTSGTSTSVSCTITPATLWNRRPTCSVDVQSSATQAVFTVSPSGVINISGVADSTTYNVICLGQPGG